MMFWSVNVMVLFFVLFSTAQGNKAEKEKGIQEIIDKVYKISSDALAKAADENEKNDILNSIETKLKESKLHYGDKGDKFAHIIMHGVKALIAEGSTRRDFRKHDFKPLLDVLKKVNNTDIKRKDTQHVVVDKIAKKLIDIANKYIKDAETPEKKINLLKKIRYKVLDMVNSKEGGNKLYVNLMTRGLEQMMKKFAHNKRRSELVYKKINKEDRPFEEKKHPYVNFVVNNGNHFNMSTTTHVNTEGYTSTPFKSCDATIRETCVDLQALQIYKCFEKLLPLTTLCNGKVDCKDHSDEEYCLDKAMAILHKATLIMTNLETFILEQCYLSSDSIVLIKQKEVLENVLHTQRTIIGQFSGLNSTERIQINKGIKAASNELASVLHTIGTSLEASLCTYGIPDRNKMNAQKVFQVFDDDIIHSTKPLKKCECHESFCTEKSCPESCKLVCWYKYSLARWSCQAIDETNSISLNKICDGQLDCYDESDEVGCNTDSVMINKFEANAIYDKVLNMIELKAKSKEYSSMYTKLMLFYNSVKWLQETALTKDIDVALVKSARDQCFSYLLSIYENVVKSSTVVGDLDDAQMFLKLVNEKLVAALKHSYVNNNKTVPQDGCVCRKNKCITLNCPNHCQQACKVREHFTKYWCKESNISIPIEWICNRRPDCPFEDDEAQCKVDICRKHHLLLMKESILHIGDDKKGTALGETLRDWREKVISTLEETKKNYRPSPITLQGIIGDILNKLVMTYSTLETKYRRNNENNYFKTFLKVSEEVIGYLKLCNQ